MKFLVNWKLLQVPPELALKLVPASLAYEKDLMEKGKVQLYAILGKAEGIGIAEAESEEELSGMLMNDPLALFLEFDVKPLRDFEESVKTFMKKLEEISKKG